MTNLLIFVLLGMQVDPGDVVMVSILLIMVIKFRVVDEHASRTISKIVNTDR